MVGLTILKRAASASMHSNASFFISQNGAQIPSVASCIHMQSSFKTLKTLAPHAAFSPSSRHFPSFNIPPAERSLEILSGESFWARKFGYFSGEGFKRQQRFRQIRSFWRHRVFTERETEGMERVAMNSVMGEIHLIVGPMFAGKTTALIRRMQLEIQMGRTVVLVKSDKDTRYGTQAVVSHDGAKLPCWSAPDLASFKARIGEEIYKKVDVIGIDEAQFFKDLYNFCQVAADKDGKILIVAGLDGDYLRKSFGSALDLIPLADSVVKLKSRCEICGKAASFTLRKTGDRSTEVIGGADIYMPVCRQHYLNGQLIIDATRAVLETNVVELESPLIAEVVPSA